MEDKKQTLIKETNSIWHLPLSIKTAYDDQILQLELVERQNEHEREKGQVNNLILAQSHGCIPVNSADEENNAVLANQSSNSTNLQEALCHDVIVLYCD